MKKLTLFLAATLLVAAIVATPGCSGVILNAEYSRLLDETAALSASTADAADAGELTEEEMTEALILQAQRWQQFRDARDGKKAE